MISTYINTARLVMARKMLAPTLRLLASAATATATGRTTSSTDKPYGRPTTYRQSIWQGTPPPEPVKPDEFWPQQALTYQPKLGWSAKKDHRKILVAIGTSDWAGSVTALRTAFGLAAKDDTILVYNAPKAVPGFKTEEIMKEGLKMAALIRNVQAISKEYNRPAPHIEMAPTSPQPKIEVVKKAAMADADLVVLGHGRYPWNAMGNVASYVVLHAPCDVLVVKGGCEDQPHYD